MKPCTAGLLLALLAFARPAAPQGTASSALEVSYCDLIKAPQTLSGKRIRVRAIYRYGFEIQRLDPPDCCPQKPVKIWVEMGTLDRRSRTLVHRFPKDMGLVLAVFAGVLESGGPYGDGGYRLKFTIDQVWAPEASAHPSATSLPSWVPRSCE